MACFADVNVSQGSVATYARCDLFNFKFTKESSSEKILKSVEIWQNYGHESVAPFFGPPCIYYITCGLQHNVPEFVLWHFFIMPAE